MVISTYEVILPLYEYQCPTCGRFEVIQKFSDSPLSACPTCGKGVTKLLSAPAIQFKGAGWYVTDYARKSGSGDGKPAESTSASKDAGSKDASSSSSSSSTDKSSPSTPSSATSSASGSSPSK